MNTRHSQSSAKIRQVQDLRRSGAHGIHGKWSKDRVNIKRKAIQEEQAHG